MANDASSLCRRFEGLRLRAYLCAAGVPSVGYGTVHYPDGVAVRLTDPAITAEQAEAYLQHDLELARRQVLALCPAVTGGQLEALTSFVYNLGAGRLRASTLRKRVNAGDPSAHEEFHKWVYGGGKKLRGLVARRAVEAMTYQEQHE